MKSQNKLNVSQKTFRVLVFETILELPLPALSSPAPPLYPSCSPATKILLMGEQNSKSIQSD